MALIARATPSCVGLARAVPAVVRADPVGYYVRRRVEESPVFAELAERKERRGCRSCSCSASTLLVIIAALVFAGNNAVGYMTTGGYIQRYATDPEGLIGSRGRRAGAVTLGRHLAAVHLLAGWISDRIGRRTTYIIGWILQLVGVFLLFPLVNTGASSAVRWASRSSRSASASPTARRRRCTPSCSRHPSASRASRSRTRSARSSAARSRRRSRGDRAGDGLHEAVTWYLAGMTVLGLSRRCCCATAAASRSAPTTRPSSR
jgi:hypothetical protein